MKYRKKPVVIDAEQLTEKACLNYFKDNSKLFMDKFNIQGSWNINTERIHNAYIAIETLEGNMLANLGDWVIKGVKGDFYPCKPDIFARTYEKAE